ncbi:MAG: GTPase HflX [Anaerovoracaceae bacterium]|jgi:GTP-binding protein HflX
MLKFGEDNETVTNEHERVILVGAQLEGQDISYSMSELAGLAQAAGAEVIGEAVQNLEKVNTATFIGRGKVDELADYCSAMKADAVIFNEELSGIQTRNLEKALKTRVIDRTVLILDIFALRAKTKEGKLQVELAQLQYLMPRIAGFDKSLSRQAGGIGTRGPGETQLETDRRHYIRRMDSIRSELKRMKKTRTTTRKQRERSGIPVVALVGYTNAGKSSLMNRMLLEAGRVNKDVYEEDMLFATLDTEQRRIKLGSTHEFILTDTVGFVSGLPHTLIDAFKATLEEVTEADLLLEVVDASYEGSDFQIEVTDKVLSEIGAGGKDRITVYNKTDLTGADFIGTSTRESVNISAKTGANIGELLRMIEDHLFSDRETVTLMIPYDMGSLVSYICDHGVVSSIEHTPGGTKITAELIRKDYDMVKKYGIV